jgi:DNA-binding NarL/FixJ family response regulator
VLQYCLPVRELAAKLEALVTKQANQLTRPRVMIVEDERVVALNIESRLSDVGYDVIASVSTGEEALQSATSSRPDVVVMDIQLPGPMNGIAAARALWEQFQIPIVYLTAYCDEKTLQDAAAASPCGYVVKPFRAPQLHAAICMALERSAQA